MKHHYALIALTVSVLLFSVNLSCALENKVGAEQEAAAANSKIVQSRIEARRKAAVRGNPVEINRATSKQLQKLPGVSAVVAQKIIAGRPYASARDLLTRNIINKEVYDNIRRRIYVMPAKKNAANNTLRKL